MRSRRSIGFVLGLVLPFLLPRSGLGVDSPPQRLRIEFVRGTCPLSRSVDKLGGPVGQMLAGAFRGHFVVSNIDVKDPAGKPADSQTLLEIIQRADVFYYYGASRGPDENGMQTFLTGHISGFSDGQRSPPVSAAKIRDALRGRPGPRLVIINGCGTTGRDGIAEENRMSAAFGIGRETEGRAFLGWPTDDLGLADANDLACAKCLTKWTTAGSGGVYPTLAEAVEGTQWPTAAPDILGDRGLRYPGPYNTFTGSWAGDPPANKAGVLKAVLTEAASKITGSLQIGGDRIPPGIGPGEYRIESNDAGVRAIGVGRRQFGFRLGQQVRGIMELDDRDQLIRGSLQIDSVATSGPFAGSVGTDWIGDFVLRRVSGESYLPEPKKYPVVFVPGIGGSRLFNQNKEMIWPAPIANYTMPDARRSSELRLPKSGIPDQTCPPLNATLLETTLNTPVALPWTDVYLSMVRALERAGYVLGKDLFLCPYDWRLDNARSAAELTKVVDTALATSGKEKVVLVCHSMGGLVCRKYLAVEGPGKVSKLITMATPHLGATRAYYALLQGYTFGNSSVDPLQLMIVAKNWTAAYQLAPWREFIRSGPTGHWPLWDSYCVSFNGPEEIFPLVWRKRTDQDSTLNWDLALAASHFREDLDPRNPPPVPTFTIVAVNEPTLDSYVAEPFIGARGKSASVTRDGQAYYLRPVAGNGDGTVPLWSLTWPKGDTRFYVEGTHVGMVGQANVQSIVTGILQGKISAPPTEFRDIPPRPSDEWVLEAEIYCPANLHFYDGGGKHDGLNENGSVEESIPRSMFLRDEDRQYFFLYRATGPYRGRVAAYDAGEFTLVLTARGPGKAKTFTYPHVKIEKTTVAEFEIPSVAGMLDNPPKLKVTTGGQQTTVTPQVTDAPPPDEPIDGGGQPGARTPDDRMPPFDDDVNLTDPVAVPVQRGPALWAGSRSVLQGEVTWLPVWAFQVNDLASLNAELAFDAAALRGEGARPTGQVSHMLFEGNTNEAGVVRLGWAGKRGMSGNPQAAAVGFRATGSPGQRVPVRLKVTESVDSRGTPMPLTTADGTIVIVANRPWSSLDAGRALKMSVGSLPEERELDVNADGRVTSRDAVVILQIANRRRG